MDHNELIVTDGKRTIRSWKILSIHEARTDYLVFPFLSYSSYDVTLTLIVHLFTHPCSAYTEQLSVV